MDKPSAQRRISEATPQSGEAPRGSMVSKTVSKGPRSTVKFGGVTVVTPKPSREQVKKNVAASTEALERVTKRLVRPGVRVYAKKNVPLFSADPRRPGVYIRTLNGKTECGIVENGVFKVTD